MFLSGGGESSFYPVPPPCYIFPMSCFVATCGPTGVGKTYQMQRMLQADPARYTAVLSVTTRARRGSEDDRWYRFVTRDELTTFAPEDILSDMEFRGERYLLLQSDIDQALSRAPIALMAIVPSVILRMRKNQVPHGVLNCRVGNRANYEARLRRRGYVDEALNREVEIGMAFAFPPSDPVWPQTDVFLGSDADDDVRCDAALTELVTKILPLS